MSTLDSRIAGADPEEYHDVDHEVRRIEMEIETTSDDYLEKRKKHRLFLKDELYAILRASHSV